jgi:enoyl-CoA hydratase
MSGLMIEERAGLCTADRDGVLVATIERPPANAMSRSVVAAIANLFRNLADTEHPPPVVITGAGERFFSAGGDIKELAGAAIDQLDGRMRLFHDMLVAMDRYPRPVVAAVNGYCVGGGVEYAMFADVVLAAPHAQFGFPEIRHGLLPAEKGIQRVARLIGMRATRDLLLSGDLVDAQRAAQLGLVDVILEPSGLVAAAVGRAREEGDKAPVLYAALKRALNDFDDAEDDRRFALTLDNAAAYFNDPVARGLREGWRRRS